MSEIAIDRELELLRKIEALVIERHRLAAENEKLRAALDEYQCPGLADCPVQKLKDGSCINAGVGHCGDTAFRALHQQQAVNSEEGK